MKFQNIMFRVNDIDASLKFYQEVLGLKIVDKIDFQDSALHYLAVNEDAPRIVLCYNANHPETYTPGSSFGYVTFEVPSIEDFSARLQKAGYAFHREPFTISQGEQVAFVKDPDGHSIELIEKNTP